MEKKPSQFLSHVTANAGLSRYTRQTPTDLFETKATTDRKNNIPKF